MYVALSGPKGHESVLIREDYVPDGGTGKKTRIVDEGATYYGPFAATGDLETFLELIRQTYPLRLCSGPLERHKNPCLYHHIHKCCAPCTGDVDEKEYKAYIDEIRDLLSGNDMRTRERLAPSQHRRRRPEEGGADHEGVRLDRRRAGPRRP